MYYQVQTKEDDCGHQHTTLRGAMACEQKLMNWSEDGKYCNAHWYHCTIAVMDHQGIIPITADLTDEELGWIREYNSCVEDAEYLHSKEYFEVPNQ